NLIDDEVKRIVEEAHDKAHTVLTEHLDELHRIAAALREYETLTGDEIKALARGENIRKPNGDAAVKKPAPSLPSSRARKAAMGEQPASDSSPAA
ncbi:MAG: cell division protein FtsH, partial [Pseudomonadota bacterium]|nr:cell division protein FtsH [Pseudomonadota bacterium]